MAVRPDQAPTVEDLIGWIQRAVRDPETPGPYDDADREYAQDTLDQFVPGLGEFVARLPFRHEQARGL